MDDAAALADGAVAAVVIGRNEGARLAACLESLDPRVMTVIYVDSGSTDDSLTRARAAGARAVALDTQTPFTAARARNAGVAALAALPAAEQARFIQFVDGDCSVEAGWLSGARAHLEANPRVAAVCGRRRERHPDASPYNRLCDMEWNTPIGDADACGGDAMMRRDAFEAAGGFDPTLIAGEEPELCLRLRRAGWTIRRLDLPMTRHDAAMIRFGQWWRRSMRAGWTFAEGAARYGRDAERYNVRRARGVWAWGAVGPALALTGAAAAAAGSVAAAVGVAAIAAAYPLMALRVARGRRRRGDSWRHALLYGAATMLGKLPQAIGQARHALTARSDTRRIIEYK